MSPDTNEAIFHQDEYQHELESWLRRRFVYLCLAYAVLAGITFLLGAIGLAATGAGLDRGVLRLVEGVAGLGIVAGHYFARGRATTREDLLGGATRMILLLGAVSIGMRFVAEWLDVAIAGSMLLAIFFWHLTACLFLPWPPRESLRPILPLMAVWAAYTLLLGDDTIVLRALAVMFSPGILMPGLLICGWRLRRHSREFRSVMMGRHVRTLRQEFSRARAIHEELFPAPYDDGYVRIGYAYEPMRELGGDFLHLHGGPGGLVHLALIDVTGHGLAAALTVNRLYGELERIRAETPDTRPAEVLALLNRYIALTMARHNIFATGIVLTLDPYRGELHWASAGHPPAFLRGINRVVRELGSTGLLLGAVHDDAYEIDERQVELAPGDVIVPFTDGAYEVRDRAGSQLGLATLREMLAETPPTAGWPESIRSAVHAHRAGRAEDDILVAAMTFLCHRTKTSAVRPAAATA